MKYLAKNFIITKDIANSQFSTNSKSCCHIPIPSFIYLFFIEASEGIEP